MSAAAAVATDTREATSQYLSFVLADAEYALDILKVREIRGWEEVTALPDAPAHVLGVMDLRGDVVPIMDLRLRFGLDRLAHGPTTVVIVARVGDPPATRTVGLVVDAVSEVYTFPADDRELPPHLAETIDSRFVQGLGKADGRLIVLLDVDRLIGPGTPAGRDAAETAR